jgi:LysM repeat protein
VTAVRRYHLVSAPTEQDRLAFECAPACEKTKAKHAKGKLTRPTISPGLPEKAADAKIFGVKLFEIAFLAFISAAVLNLIASAQTAAPTPAKSSDAAQLEALTKKIDEQNAKIDTLSQQILKLQQQIANARPGVMIGEGASPSSAPTTPLPETSPRGPTNGSSHVVARGETLTSIAKMYGVSVSDLQKYNHIDNPLKLQAGQTILIPSSPTPAPSASSSGE